MADTQSGGLGRLIRIVAVIALVILIANYPTQFGQLIGNIGSYFKQNPQVLWLLLGGIVAVWLVLKFMSFFSSGVHWAVVLLGVPALAAAAMFYWTTLPSNTIWQLAILIMLMMGVLLVAGGRSSG